MINYMILNCNFSTNKNKMYSTDLVFLIHWTVHCSCRAKLGPFQNRFYLYHKFSFLSCIPIFSFADIYSQNLKISLNTCWWQENTILSFSIINFAAAVNLRENTSRSGKNLCLNSTNLKLDIDCSNF